MDDDDLDLPPLDPETEKAMQEEWDNAERFWNFLKGVHNDCRLQIEAIQECFREWNIDTEKLSTAIWRASCEWDL